MVGKVSFSLCEEPLYPSSRVAVYSMLGSAKQQFPNSGNRRLITSTHKIRDGRSEFHEAVIVMHFQ